ncbi:hypothetical protein EI42_02876 [Thermosporothrix hazakensis]|uniref:Uncharacterized protein n=2 Tax=Thermosporothrix TaxID=768650 RepID=A0A326U6T4_THEHA|nr:hypothetical protein [Thermosporothrix hazakensis]PZW29580.1 hypothetical protein EI42_02876 [Thermosporothrix hazakensis]BBH85866.1 hypothetical protein KTC_06170 [Thermosporothrix sp. COM3]GCE45707.1 hypothetical protein KTH_05760 [Thermosporothrix hazakensis]
MSQSEVARLREQIEQEFIALRRGLSGLSSGMARHSFIHSRMERIGSIQSSLAEHVGEKEATHVMCELYMQNMEQMVNV